MKKIEITVYKFDELTPEAQAKATEKFFDINVNYEWWQYIFEDAKNIGLKIESFDIDRGNYCKGKLINSLYEVCDAIIKEHGDQCETYKTAKDFQSQWDSLVVKYSDGVQTDRVAEDNEYEFDKEADELESDFLQSLSEDYRIILSKEYEYLTSYEAIIETIKCNEYDFLENGEQY